MNDYWLLTLILLLGIMLGLIFFGGLWWTVRAGIKSERPALLFLGSLLVRTALVLTGFYYAGGSEWQRFVACLSGFVIARIVVWALTRPALSAAQPEKTGSYHAP